MSGRATTSARRRDVLRFDFPEVHVGTAEYEEGPTGCTVLWLPAGAQAAVDFRGGAVAARELATVGPLDGWGEVDAVVFAGGSTWGLDAAGGVMHRLLEEREGDSDFEDIPAVPAAAVYDFSGRDNTTYPDVELGMAALDAARPGEAPVGRVGAGRNVTVGSYFGDRYAEPSGQGAAFERFGDVKMFALTVVNAGGNVFDREGRLVAGTRDPATGTRSAAWDKLRAFLEHELGGRERRRGTNTVLSVVVTNVALDRLALLRLAVMAQAALARVVDPLHTPEDGDVVFALSTQSAKLPSALTVGDLGILAGKVLQDAVLDAVRPA